MGIFTRLLEELYRFAAKYRCASIVVGVGALTILSLGVSEPALAQCSGPTDNTICSGTFNTNINVGSNNTPVNLTLQPGVIVNSLGGNAVNAANTTASEIFGADVTLTANNATVTNISNVAGNNNTGLRIQAAGAATITASGGIDVAGTASDWAILAIIQGTNPDFPKNIMVTYGGGPGAPGLGLNSNPSGAESGGIQADNRGNGNASVVASGNVTVFSGSGQGVYGLEAHAGDPTFTGVAGAGDASVTYQSGTINESGGSARGILAWTDGDGSTTVTTDPGTAINVSGTSPGVYAFSSTATAANLRAVTANVASTITTSGSAVGIKAFSGADAPIAVTYSGPGITTAGGSAHGIAGLSGSGSVNVNSTGPITTNGSSAFGILADSGTIANATRITGAPGTEPPTVVTASVSGALGGPIVVTTSGQGSITTQGVESHGIWATSTTGTVQVNAAKISTTGEFSAGINAAGGGGTTVNVAQGASVMGGWQADLTSVGPLDGLPAAGVILSSTGGTATLTNNGSIGALSDRAIAGDPQVISNGTITGFTQFTGGDNSILNNGAFNLRDFEDTTGAVGGVRDTVRVAIADLGTGVNNTFTNNGTLALASVTGATTLLRTGEYLPLGNPSNAMALGGPLQGQMIGVTTFTNSGVIDLQANPVPGDVLMITGGRGGSQPGIGGGGTYFSNGGSLKLDTVLNEGGAATLSDTLVVDGTSVSPGGATQTFIHNVGGTGALTQGDGILVVQVLDPARSAAGAFALPSGELRAGAFDYDLFHGGINGSNPADWFLRSDIVVEPAPPVVPPETSLPPTPPPNPLPPGVYPIIGPELATYGVVQPLARQLGLSILGTLDDRVGDTYEPDGCAVAPAVASAAAETSAVDLPTKKPAAVPTKKPGPAPCPLFSPSVWGRFFGQTLDNHYRAFADPRASGNLGGFQGGIDLLRGSLIAGHYERAGLYGAYGDVNADVDGLVTNPAATAYVLSRTGSMNLDAWSAGGYWTHVGPGGWYLDAVLQGTWYYGSASTQFARLNTDGTGFIASLEGGYPYAWPQLGPGFVIEPQGQILWQKVSFRHDYDGLGDVALGDTTGPSGRIGLRTKWTIATAGDQVWQPYLRANLWRDWGAEANAVYSGTDIVPLVSQTTRLELGGGVTGRINANVSVFANVDYEFAVGASEGDKRNGVRGAFGARYTW